MTMTTDPRNVRTGRVQLSFTSTVKRDALIGRRVEHTTADGTTLVGTVESISNTRPVIRFPDGRWAYGTSVVTLTDRRS